MNYNQIFPYGFKHKDRACRLYCFHHAGGSAFVFKNWLDFSGFVETVPTDIPDREKNFEELHFETVINDAARAIAKTADKRPIFIYGHSLGALFAFQTTYRLKKEYGIEIKKLFVAGRHAPSEESNSDFKCSNGEEALYKELRKDGGITEKVLNDEMFKKYFLPKIFNDYRLNEEYAYHGEILDIPIIALNGNKDIDATLKIMKKWENITKEKFRQYEFEGNHFFPYGEGEKEVLKIMLLEIKETLEKGK